MILIIVNRFVLKTFYRKASIIITLNEKAKNTDKSVDEARFL